MRKLLLVFPAGVLLVVAGHLLGARFGQDPVFRVLMCATAALASIAGWRAAHGFEPGDYLRRAWMCTASAYGIISVSLAIPDGISTVLDLGLGVLINIVAVSGVILFARAHRVAGLALPGSHARRVAAVVVCVGLALAVDGWPIVDSIRRVAGGDPKGWTQIISSAGDLVALCFLVPVVLTALALRGGLAGWPWFFLAGANLSWLLYDVQSLLHRLLPGITPEAVEAWANLWQVLACFLTFAAGLAQRWVSRGELTTDERA